MLFVAVYSGQAMMGKETSSTALIAMATVMAALVTITTMLIQIPIPATDGFFNIGDAMIMVAALTGGPIVGVFAGGIGSSLADFLGGWYVWVIPTLIIKGTEGFLAGWILRRGKQNLSNLIFAWIIGGGVMVLGYFLVQIYMYGFAAALVELPFNFVQMAVGGIVGIPISQALKRMIRI
jgi:uncharacterized membrane protein